MSMRFLFVVLVVIAFAGSARAASLHCHVDVERLCEAGQVCHEQTPRKPLTFRIINNNIEAWEWGAPAVLRYRTIHMRRREKITRWVNVDGSRFELREAPGRARASFNVTSNDRNLAIRRTGWCMRVSADQALSSSTRVKHEAH
jgi:hypothetical protein